MTQRIETRFYGFPQTLLGRVIGALLAVALVVSAFFFLLIFLVVAGTLILGISLRLLWRAKKARDQASQDVIEGEFSVERRDESAKISEKL